MRTTENYNPDVLSCLANLSSDEVFTPPGIVNQMLDMLPDGLWHDTKARFLDPACKSGVFLREIAKRLDAGLESQIPDRQARIDHIFRNQLYGLAITELTALLTRRSLYCSKTASGKYSVCTAFDDEQGNVRFERVEHSWRDGRCALCGAPEGQLSRGDELESHAYRFIHTESPEEVFGMQFDVIISNPPYQLKDEGFGTSAAPIYQHFVEQAKKLNPRHLCMIVPSRWFAGGKGLDEFRETMLSDNRLRVIHDYWQVGDVFPGVAIQGGVLYFLWSRDEPGDCHVVTHYEGRVISSASRPLREAGAAVFIRYNEAVPILKKIVAAEGGRPGSVLLPAEKRFASMVSPRKPFGLDTKFGVRATRRSGDLVTYWNGGPGFKQGGKGWVSASDVTTGHELINAWKVFVGGAYGDRGGGGASRDSPPRAVLGRPFVGAPGSVSTETYVCIGPLRSEDEAKNVASYIACRLARLLVLLHKPAQHATRKVYAFVPTQDFTEPWTDKKLYEKYGLTDDEIAFVEWMIRPMALHGQQPEAETDDLDAAEDETE